jgi:uncharacterized protein YkwD
VLARHRLSVPWLLVILIVACLGPVLVHGAVDPDPGGDSVRLANASNEEAASTDSSEPVGVTTTVGRGSGGGGGGDDEPGTGTDATEAPTTTTTEAPANTTTKAPATTTTPPDAPATTTTVPGDEPTPADEVLALVNEARAAAATPCPPLTTDPSLQAAAEVHTDDMATRGYLDHVTPEGQDPKARAVAQGYGGLAVGENIAQGYPDAQAVVDAWLGSEGHRANIENCDYKVTGVGANADGWYWTQVFGL